MASSQEFDHLCTECRVYETVPHLITWLIEATNLHVDGPTIPLTVRRDAPSDTMQTLWNTIKSTAAFCSAAVVCQKQGKVPFGSIIDLDLALTHRDHWCFDSETLVRAVAKIVQSHAGVHLPCIIETLEYFKQESEAILRELDGTLWSMWDEY
jgi:hypothetical protein